MCRTAVDGEESQCVGGRSQCKGRAIGKPVWTLRWDGIQVWTGLGFGMVMLWIEKLDLSHPTGRSWVGRQAGGQGDRV